MLCFCCELWYKKVAAKVEVIFKNLNGSEDLINLFYFFVKNALSGVQVLTIIN